MVYPDSVSPLPQSVGGIAAIQKYAYTAQSE